MRLSRFKNNGVLGTRRGNVGVLAGFGMLIIGSNCSVSSVGSCFRTGVDLICEGHVGRAFWGGVLEFVKTFVFVQRVGSVLE